MCEYCGCQALATIDQLTREHDFVVNMIGEARAAHAVSDTARMAGLARQITAILGPHTEVEERGLFPALTADFPDHVAGLKAEHRRVEAALGEAAAGTPDDPAWSARFAEALTLLREHILKGKTVSSRPRWQRWGPRTGKQPRRSARKLAVC